jgi:excisionase family DNA binding protein
MKNDRPTPQYVGLAELASRISLSPRTIRSLIHDPAHPLPAIRVGNKLLFKLAAVERYLDTHQIRVSDIEAVTQEIMEKLKQGGKT